MTVYKGPLHAPSPRGEAQAGSGCFPGVDAAGWVVRWLSVDPQAVRGSDTLGRTPSPLATAPVQMVAGG